MSPFFEGGWSTFPVESLDSSFLSVSSKHGLLAFVVQAILIRLLFVLYIEVVYNELFLADILFPIIILGFSSLIFWAAVRLLYAYNYGLFYRYVYKF